MSRLVVVTASTNFERAWPCVKTWGDVSIVLVLNGGDADVTAPFSLGPVRTITKLIVKDYLGTVPAFKAGVDYALEHMDAGVIACLHDDLEIHDSSWVERVLRHFDTHPATGLAGFGGAIGLADEDIYQTPYQPVQLARKGFRSNLIDAEVHGLRSLLAEPVACLDGFSQIGRWEFWKGYTANRGGAQEPPPWHLLDRIGVRHHAYDSALGAIAKRYGWETWYLPVRCRHLGGMTAVGDQGYQRWAQTQTEGGDHGFWEQAHAAVYAEFKAELPIRL